MGGEGGHRGTHRRRRWADGDEVCARWRGPDNKEPRRIVEHAVVPPHRLDAAYGVSKAVGEAKTVSLQRARTRREEEPASLIDPDLQSRSSGTADQIRIAVAIHIRDHELDKEIARGHPLRAACDRQPDCECVGPATDLDAIVSDVAVEIRAQTLSLRGIGNQQRRDAA